MSHQTIKQDAMPAATANSISPLDAIRLLRSAGGALFAQAALHAQLAKVEWAEEKARLSKLALAAALAFICVHCTLLLTGALVLAASWSTAYRVHAITAVMAVYVLGIVATSSWLITLSRLGSQAFAATRAEVAADVALLRSRL
jgi:uncharacterized membrane protein YqjE